MTNTQILRDAAVKIRDAALAAGEHHGDPADWYAPADHPALLGVDSPMDTTHIALWSPTVALRSAALLADIAASVDAGELQPEGAIARSADRFADLVLARFATTRPA
jgi:hypothetical protein